jgi:2-keto-4-pentenoate hydratase/2-oxohepta-3-ene-1,7-dioic acid hydratase in catechol pathway
MRWLRYRHEASAHYGILDGDQVIEVAGTPFDGPKPTGRKLPLSEVCLLAPVQPVGFFAAAQPNHLRHVKKSAERRNVPVVVPTHTDFNYRGPNALIGTGDAVVLPADSSGTVQMEGELAVVIGRTAKRVAEKDALDYVFGYTICNDISERRWQFGDRTVWRGKNTDTFNPMGPWIETELDLAAAVTHIRLNGRELGHFPTNEMIFSVRALIAAISRNITLSPGDVILTGADEPTPDMVAGDIAEIEITGIGVLRNPIVAET